MPDITNTANAMRQEAREVAEYVEWLETTLTATRRDLVRAVRKRPIFDAKFGRIPVHTGVTQFTRALLTDRSLPRAEIERVLTENKIPYTRKGLSVMLSQNFKFTADPEVRGEGMWGLATVTETPVEAAPISENDATTKHDALLAEDWGDKWEGLPEAPPLVTKEIVDSYIPIGEALP